MKVILILIAILVSGCMEERIKTITLEGVGDHLYWHEGIRYTIKSVTDSGEVKSFKMPYRVMVRLFEDKSIKSGVRYRCEYTTSGWSGNKGWCKIYINSVEDLQTANWNHGKFGSGTTKRLTN